MTATVPLKTCRTGLALSASIMALAISHNAQAQAALCPSGQPGPVCFINNTGTTGSVVGTNGNVTLVENSGTISGTTGVLLGGSSALAVENEVGGTITGTGGTAIAGVPRLFFTVENSGTINGNVVYDDAPANNLFTNPLTYYVASGGTVNGNVTLGTSGFTSSIFLYRGSSTGVTGTISAGAGIDIFGRIYEASQSVAIGQNVLPSTFEIEAFYADGPATTLTLTGTGTTVSLGGDGHVINTATINPVSTSGLFPGGFTFNPAAVTYVQPQLALFRRPQIQLGQPGSFFTIGFGNALGSFTNNGIINSDVNLATASFVNAGSLNLQTASFGTTIFSAANQAFVFQNSGSITLAPTGARYSDNLQEFEDGRNAAVRLRSAINTTQTADVTIDNSGQIVGGINGRLAASDFVFENSGSIAGLAHSSGYFAHGLVLWVGELRLVAGQNPETHFDAASASFTNSSTGIITHGTQLHLSADTASVVNHGVMSGADNAAIALEVEQYLDADGIDSTSFAFENTGTFNGNVSLDAAATTVTVENSGDITGAGYTLNSTTFPEVVFGGGVAFEVNNETASSSTVEFTNTGDITTTAHAQSGVVIAVDTDDDDNELTNGNANVSVVNSGTIAATGGATVITPQFAPFLLPTEFLINPLGALVVDASDVPGTSVIAIENQAGGVIRAGGNLHVASPNGYFPVPDPVPGVFTVALLALGQTINITNAGTIQGGAGTNYGVNIVSDTFEPREGFLAGAIQTEGDEFGPEQVYIASVDTVTNTATGVIIGSVDLGGNNDTIINRGRITGAVLLRDGDDVVSNYGSLEGDIFFGAGNDTFTQGVGALFDGIADGEAGEDKFFLDLTGGGTIDQTIYDKLLNFESFALIGQGQVDVDLGDANDTFENEGTLEGEVNLGSGDNTFTNTGTVGGNVTGGEGADDLGNEGTIEGDVDLGEGSNQFDNTGNVIGDITGGNNTDDVQNEGEIEGSVDLGSGDNVLGNSGTITGDVTSGSGADEVANDGTIEGNVDLGDGANEFANTGDVEGDVTAGNDDDTVDNSGTITGDVNLDTPEQASEPQSTFTARRVLAAVVVPTTGGDDTFSNDGTLNGNLFAGAGNDVITNSATITGLVDLGEGDDTLILEGTWVIGGDVTGGAGSDALALNLAGSAGPRPLDLADFSSFETMAVSGGTGVIQGNAAFAQINVGSGRLIGAADSTITGNVAVASGGTFGSAGQVNGNISVASGGTLSPGASPAVMNVTGNVSLASGSTTVFEFVPSPGQSDQLVIDGNLTIAAGATLNLTGNRPRTPGIAYDMIIADAISGQFTIGTWDRTLVQGFLRYVDGATTDRLQLLGTFVFQNPAAPQPTAAMNYVNDLLVGGTASPALLAAINPLLDSNGYASVQAFSLLTPEPYASANQLAVETGLSLARTGRSGIARGTGDEAGLYGFGSASGAWRGLAADAPLGTAHARNRAQGVIGGLGFGSESASLGGFVGYVEGRQRIAALGAQTNSDGMVAGLSGHIGAGGFNLDAMVGYDWSKADTARSVPANGSVNSHYDLESLVLDAAATVDLALGRLTLTPGAGITHVAVRRGAASESGSAAFALNVDGDHHAATFVDGSITMSGSTDNAVRPWASVGIRHQLEGDLVFASAALVGSNASFTVPGAPRKDTVITAGAGIEASVASNVSITASYDGEFGAGTGSTATLGLRARF